MEYIILIYGDEKRWEAADDATRSAIFAAHGEFSRALAERGHKVTASAPLYGTADARTVRGTADDFVITDGPFAETAEQLGGFYVVDTDNVDELTSLAAMVSFGESIEIRPLVPSGETH